jgi:hypothetical protein
MRNVLHNYNSNIKKSKDASDFRKENRHFAKTVLIKIVLCVKNKGETDEKKKILTLRWERVKILTMKTTKTFFVAGRGAARGRCTHPGSTHDFKREKKGDFL